MASGNLINQIRAKVRNVTGFYFVAPLIQFSIIHFPKLATKFKVLQHRISLTFFKKVFCQTHIWTKTVHLWRTRTFASFEQILFCLFNSPISHRNATEHKISILNGVAVVPITLKFWGKRKQFRGVILGIVNLANVETLFCRRIQCVKSVFIS